MFAIVNARSIDNHNVNITKLNMEQFNETVQHSQNVWMIQFDLSGKPSVEFKKAAYVLRGIVKAGIIEECHGNDICKERSGKTLSSGKVIFIHSEGVDTSFINNQNYTSTVAHAEVYIQNKTELQKNIINFNKDKVKIVMFSSENI